VIGETPRQIAATVTLQAMLLSALAIVPGLFAGVLLAYIITHVLHALYGHAVQFEPRMGFILAYFLAATLLVAFAAFLPADRAARLDLLQGLHDE
jgi:ABC-type antimicrobial peptide transport system permease subunit